MTLQTSGAISLSQIQAEFGGSNPISLSEYYRGGSFVTGGNPSVPTSGAISLSDFYGTQRSVEFTFVGQANAGNTTSTTYINVGNTGRQPGDLVIVFAASVNAAPFTLSGYTDIVPTTNNWRVQAKVAEAGDSDNPQIFGSSFSPTAMAIAYRPSDDLSLTIGNSVESGGSLPSESANVIIRGGGTFDYNASNWIIPSDDGYFDDSYQYQRDNYAYIYAMLKFLQESAPGYTVGNANTPYFDILLNTA